MPQDLQQEIKMIHQRCYQQISLPIKEAQLNWPWVRFGYNLTLFVLSYPDNIFEPCNFIR